MKNKRSAVLTAGGLAASFMAGAAAVTFHWGMGTSSASTVAAAPSRAAAPKPLKPIVKHRTIVVHRKAPAPPATTTAPAPAPAAQTVVVPAPAPTSTTSKSVTTTGGSPTAAGENEHEGSDD
ncbi:MAG TPA: hypothetical protein VHW68_03260 [Actinomycetota bacterium]|jgi:hypothetical protein|nr:hypothetical protein [Actinomycetota bacterium]